MRVAVVLLVALACLSGAFAIGLSYPYLEDNTVQLEPGQTYDYVLVIQNKEDVDARAGITLKSDLAQLIGDNPLDVPAKTYTKSVTIRVTVPPDAPLGTIYEIPFSVAPVDEVTDGGQVPFTVNYDRQFKVRIGPALEQPAQVSWFSRALHSSWLTVTLVMIIGMFLGVIVFLGRKSGQVSRRATREAPVTPTEQPVAPPASEPSIPAVQAIEAIVEPAAIAPPAPRPVAATRTCAPDQRFILRDGRALESLPELAAILPSLPDDVFTHHVNAQRNDFALWTRYSLSLPDISQQMDGAHSRDALRAVLADALQ